MFNFSNYFLNLQVVPVFTVAIIIIILGSLILCKNKKSLANVYFFILCFSIALWLGCTGMGYLSKYKDLAMFWFKIDNFGVMFIAISSYAFTSHFLQLNKEKNIMAGYFLAFTFGLLGLTNNYLSMKYINIIGAIFLIGSLLIVFLFLFFRILYVFDF